MKYIGMIWVLGCLLFARVVCADDVTVEYKIKAGYLYNFTKFIAWSADMSQNFNLCILGDDPFGELIEPIQDRVAFEKAIKLFRFEDYKDKQNNLHCHILFVDANVKVPVANKELNNTLVVGEGAEFINQGGMIGFVNKQDKIKLQINLKTLKLSGLKVSAKLLEVADVVKGEEK